MDIELDSDLGETEEVEIIGHTGETFQPYLYEPVSRNQPKCSYDNEPTQTRPSSFSVQGYNDAVSDVFIW